MGTLRCSPGKLMLVHLDFFSMKDSLGIVWICLNGQISVFSFHLWYIHHKGTELNKRKQENAAKEKHNKLFFADLQCVCVCFFTLSGSEL